MKQLLGSMYTTTGPTESVPGGGGPGTRWRARLALLITVIFVMGIMSVVPGSPVAAAGAFTTIDGPDATETLVWELNDSGDTAGRYEDGNGRGYGFVRTASGTFMVIDPPGSTDTAVSALNNSGDAAGYYKDGNGTWHGLVTAVPVNGGGSIADAQTIEQILAASDYSNELDAPVLRLYQAYFNRGPDVAGAKYWLDVRRQGHRQLAIAGYMAGGHEFANNYAGVSDEEFLQRVYQNMLGRGYDQGGFNYWLDAVRGTNQFGGNPKGSDLSRAEVVFYVTASEEFIRNYPYRNDS